MQRTKLAALVTLFKIMQKYQKSWSYASQNTLLNLLLTHHNIVIKRRMLCYHLADLRHYGLIKTWKRFKRDESGHIWQQSSASCITIKGAHLLTKLGVKGALSLAKQLLRKYGPEPKPTTQETLRPIIHPGQVPPPNTLKNPFRDPKTRQVLGLNPTPPFALRET